MGHRYGLTHIPLAKFQVANFAYLRVAMDRHRANNLDSDKSRAAGLFMASPSHDRIDRKSVTVIYHHYGSREEVVGHISSVFEAH